MKKGAFIFLFVLVAVVFVYMPHQAQSVQQTDSCAKYNSNSCLSPQCQVQTTPAKRYCFWKICFPIFSSQKNCAVNPTSQGNNNDCSSNNGQNTLSDSKPASQAEFYYGGVKTEGWKFSKVGNEIRIFYPVLSSIASNPPRTESITPNLEASNGNCKYYSFSYERPRQTLTYNLPAQSTTPTTVNGKPVCKYSMTPLTNGQSKISLLAGQPIKDLSQICPELQKGKPLSTSSGPLLPAASPQLAPQTCPSIEKCDVLIPKGSKQYFGFATTDGGKCGLAIKADNAGQAIQQGDLKNKAAQAVKDCTPKEEKKCDKKCSSHDKKNSICCKEDESCGSSKWGTKEDNGKVWCVSNPDNFVCPQNSFKCTNGNPGDGIACCPQGWSCRIYNGGGNNAAWCSPDSESSCKPPKTDFCSKESGGGKEDNSCCYPNEVCKEDSGYSWCSVPKEDCKAKGEGHTTCGFYCCNPDQYCHDNGWSYKTCTMKSDKDCPVGKEKCTSVSNGYPISFCCNIGKCVQTLRGAPICSDNIYYP